MPRQPVLQALVLADRIYAEEGTGKKIIAGTFNRITSDRFPGTHARGAWIFVNLTDFQGTIALEIQLRQMRTGLVLLQSPPIQVTSKSPLRTVDLMVELPALPMPEPGDYSLDIVHEGSILGSLRLQFAQRPTREGEP